MIFNFKKIYINKSYISINNKITKLSFFEFLNSKKHQKTLLQTLPKKITLIQLEDSLEKHYKTILTLFQNNKIIIKKIILTNNKILYQKKINYRYHCLLLICISLISYSVYLTTIQQDIKNTQKRLSLIKKNIIKLINQQNNFNNPLLLKTTELIKWLSSKPVLIQIITITPPKTIKIIVFSYKTIPSNKHQNLSIKQLTFYKKGDYYEITHTL
tara:strand:+ start:4071 stop:4712 length:642 start_codon:yes stop_codon:yes gene_type:complete